MKIFYRDHQTQSQYDENCHLEIHKRSHMKATTKMLTSNVEDDLTMSYDSSPDHYLATELDTKGYEISPNSSNCCRVVSLNGYYDEQVSPLLTASSPPIPSNKISNSLIIPGPPGRGTAKQETRSEKSTKKAIETSITPAIMEKNQDTITMTPPHAGGTRRTKCSHNRSRFVFDGNLSFGTITPSPRYAGASPFLNCSPPLGCNFPPAATPMSMSPIETPMMPKLITPELTRTSPPQDKFFISRYSYRKQHEERKTSPPTPEQQRQRNRAMPSEQYEAFVLSKLRRELFEQTCEKGVLQRRQTY